MGTGRPCTGGCGPCLILIGVLGVAFGSVIYTLLVEQGDQGSFTTIHSGSALGNLRTEATLAGPRLSQVHVGFAWSDASQKQALIVAMQSVCTTSMDDGLSIVLHVMTTSETNPFAESIAEAWQKRALKCQINWLQFVNQTMDGDGYRWDVIRTNRSEWEVKHLLQYVHLPAALGRQGVEEALLLPIQVIVLSRSVIVSIAKQCSDFLWKSLGNLACLGERRFSWDRGAVYVHTGRFFHGDMETRMYQYAMNDEDVFIRVGDLVDDFFRKSPASLEEGTTCAMPRMLLGKVQEKAACDRGMMALEGKHKVWKRKKLSDCSPSDCRTTTYCKWWQHSAGGEAPLALDIPPEPNLEQKTIGSSHPSEEKCPLTWLSPHLHLFTMTPSTDDDIMYHFLNHYRDLGIEIDRKSRIIIHKLDEESVERMRKLLQSFGIREGSVEIVETYASNEKRAAVNKYIRQLPKDAWVVYPDNDEFFTFPCSIREMIEEGTTEFFGHMLERLGPGLTLPPLQRSPSILEQYPVDCPYRLKLMKGSWASKYMLFKAFKKGQPRQYADSHRIAGVDSDTQKDFDGNNYIGEFPHLYHIGQGACDKLRWKRSLYTKGIPAIIYRRGSDLFNCSGQFAGISSFGLQRINGICGPLEYC